MYISNLEKAGKETEQLINMATIEGGEMGKSYIYHLNELKRHLASLEHQIQAIAGEQRTVGYLNGHRNGIMDRKEVVDTRMEEYKEIRDHEECRENLYKEAND